MLKKVLSSVLACLLLNLAGVSPAHAKSGAEAQARFAEKVKEGISRLGTGEAARVEVKLRNNTKLKGYVSEIKADCFIVVDAKTGVATQVAYPNVKQVKGNNLSEGAKIAIGVAIILGLGVLLAIVIGRDG